MKDNRKTFILLGVTAFILFLVTRYWKIAEAALGALAYAVMPLIGGFVVAYAVNIPMSFLEKKLFGKCQKKLVSKIKRPVSMTMAFALLAALVFLVITLVVPELVSCVKVLVDEVPPVFAKWYDSIENEYGLTGILQEKLQEQFGQNADWKDMVEKAVDFVVNGLGGVMGSLMTFVSAVFSTVFSVFASLVFAVYLLSGKETLTSGLNRVVNAYLRPQKLRDGLKRIVTVLDDCFHRFIVGQCTEAVILGVLCIVGMTIFRFPYATMIGTLVGFTALIPIAGAYIGAAVGAFMVFTADSLIGAALFIVFIVVLQQLEGNLIYPRVVGASIGLPGIWVLVAVTIGGAVGGIAGMLIGVPLCAAVYKLLKSDVKSREEKAASETPAQTPTEPQSETAESSGGAEETIV